MKFIIYGLFDPRDNQCWYVGMTQRTLAERLLNHWTSRNNHSCAGEWLQDLHSNGLKPEIREIERTDDHTREDYWIVRMIQLFHPIRNIDKSRVRVCSVYGCGRVSDSLGLCHSHYLRHRRGVPVENMIGTVSDRVAVLVWNGVERTMSEWSKELGIPVSTISRRLSAGWTVDEVLGRPVGWSAESKPKPERVIRPVLTEQERKDRKNALARKWRAANPDKVKGWYANNREHYLAYSKERHRKNRLKLAGEPTLSTSDHSQGLPQSDSLGLPLFTGPF